MTIKPWTPLAEQFKALNVSNRYGWDIVDEDDIKYSFNSVVSNLEFEACTLNELAQAVSLVFDVGYNGKFYCGSGDFYGYFRRYVERSQLDKLLVEHNEDSRKLVIPPANWT